MFLGWAVSSGGHCPGWGCSEWSSSFCDDFPALQDNPPSLLALPHFWRMFVCPIASHLPHFSISSFFFSLCKYSKCFFSFFIFKCQQPKIALLVKLTKEKSVKYFVKKINKNSPLPSPWHNSTPQNKLSYLFSFVLQRNPTPWRGQGREALVGCGVYSFWEVPQPRQLLLPKCPFAVPVLRCTVCLNIAQDVQKEKVSFSPAESHSLPFQVLHFQYFPNFP